MCNSPTPWRGFLLPYWEGLIVAQAEWVSLRKLLKHTFSETVHLALSMPYRSEETKRDPFKNEHVPHWASWDILITWTPSHPYNFMFFSNDGKNQPTNKKHYPLLTRVSPLLIQPVWTPLCSPLPNPAFLFKSPNLILTLTTLAASVWIQICCLSSDPRESDAVLSWLHTC